MRFSRLKAVGLNTHKVTFPPPSQLLNLYSWGLVVSRLELL